MASPSSAISVAGDLEIMDPDDAFSAQEYREDGESDLDLQAMVERTIRMLKEFDDDASGISGATLEETRLQMGAEIEQLLIGFGKHKQMFPEESILRLIKFYSEGLQNPLCGFEALKRRELVVVTLLETLEFRRTFTYAAEFLERVLEWLENRQANSGIFGLRMLGIISKLLVCDKQEVWETRILKLFWKHACVVPDSDLVFCLSKVAEHYTSSREAGCHEEFMQSNDERASLLYACSSVDIATCFSTDVDGALNHAKVYGEKAKCWEEKEKNLHTNAFTKLANALSIDFPITARLETAKECLDRLDLSKNMSADLNPYESDTLASVMSTVMSPELQALNALKEEIELHREVVLQVEELSERHLEAYEGMKDEQYESLKQFFQNCQKEKEDMVQEALYKKANYLASIETASINREVKLSSEDLLKRIVQKAGGAFKEAEEKLQSKSLEKVPNKKCALCYSKFSKKRKRACLDPCGHSSACFDCATKAWEKKSNCPWCNTVIVRPIPVPAKLFF